MSAGSNFPPPGYLGRAEVRQLEADGWAFCDGGIQVAGGWMIWGKKGEEWKLFCLADPDEYPDAWPTEPAKAPPSGQLDLELAI